MSYNLKVIAAVLSLFVTIIIVVIARQMFRSANVVTHAAVVIDRSMSVRSDSACTETLIRKALGRANGATAAKLSVITTGDNATADEPLLLAEYTVPTNRMVIEGRGAAARKTDEIIRDLQSKLVGIKRTTSTPIFIAIKGAIEHLRQDGCDTKSRCVLLVQSDLQETEESGLKAALAGFQTKRLPEPINNQGIAVAMFGISETNGPESRGQTSRAVDRDAQTEDRIRSVWTRLFTDKNSVTFDGLCPKR